MNQILKDLSDKQLERRVLCVAINFSHTLNDIVEVLKTSEAFTDSRNKAIFDAILEITDSGGIPNLVNLPIHLREKGKGTKRWRIKLPHRIISRSRWSDKHRFNDSKTDGTTSSS